MLRWRSGGWRLFDEPGTSSLAARGDAVAGIFDRQLVERVGIVVVEPLFGFGVALVGGVGGGFQGFADAENAAAILGRGVSLAGDVARIEDARLAAANPANGQAMLPAVAEVVEVIDDGAARFQHLAAADLAGAAARLVPQSSFPPRGDIVGQALWGVGCQA